MTKRAICLGGGGPAAGLHIGVLESLKKHGIDFDVWALSCIGAWVGVIYNQAEPGDEIPETKKFFRDVFRNDKSFKSFPTNTIFAPDWAGNAEAIWDFLLEPCNYKNALLPREIMKSFMHTISALGRMSATRRRWRRFNDREFEEIREFEEFSEGDFNRWTLNHVLAVHPVVRFLTAMMYRSKIDGLSRLYYPDSKFLKNIKFDRLYEDKKPFICHNAWNLSKQELVLFANQEVKARNFKRERVAGRVYPPIDAASLCACSALPFIEQTVEIDGDIYCEGALVDTVNFKNLLRDHPDVDEIWISRIVDADQILPPKDLYDSVANLCELFAATLGEDDVKLFRYHLTCGDDKEKYKHITIVEIPVFSGINFDWSHSNLELGIKCGAVAADETKKLYDKEMAKPKAKRSRIIGAPPEREERMKKRRESEHLRQLLRERLVAAGRACP
jgi:predicted acylesterase/phospholipase RssA